MIGVEFCPVDTWFFRDGAPFTAGATPQEDVASLFPPHPPTVTGAIRAALARSQGWSGYGRWSGEICEVLGDGPDDLGMMSITGPFLLRDRQPLFRAPRHLLGTIDADGADGNWCPKALLHPGKPVVCDLGEVRLPELAPSRDAEERLEPSDDQWLTADGMNEVLKGKIPDKSQVVSSRYLWSAEIRIGLERDARTRTAAQGKLYSTRHVRPRANVSIGVCIDGLPEGWNLPAGLPGGQMVPLGGESRLSECRPWHNEHATLGLESPIGEIRRSGKAVVIALTPLDIDHDIHVGKRPLDESLSRQSPSGRGGASVVSACTDRPQRIGGWDSLQRRPRPLRSVLAPGSVLFCEIEPEWASNKLKRTGRRTEWGFGLTVLGAWPDQKEVTR